MPGQMWPNPTRPASTARPRYGLCVGFPALSVLLAALLWYNDAVAQTTTVIGDRGAPSVEINLDAIEGAGRKLERPSGLRRFNVPSGQPIRLKPPQGMAGTPDRRRAKPAPPPARRPPIRSLAVTPPVQPPQAAVPRASDGQPTVPPTSALPATRSSGALTKAAQPVAPARQKPEPPKPAQAVPSPPPPVAKPLKPVLQTAKPEPPPPVPKAAPASPAPARATTPAAPSPPRRAALPQPTAPLPEGRAMQIMFAEGSSALNAKATAALGNLADQMARSDQRIQLKAIANSASGASPSATRRLSFSRALAVRAFLIERGVRSTRIDVRTLGATDAGGPTERVDVVLLPR